MKYILICHPRFDLNERRGWSRQIYVRDLLGQTQSQFELMCSAIDEDVLGDDGFWDDVFAKIESREADCLDLDGNAWVIYVTSEKVWFEGLYSQGEGGEVTYSQFKIAVKAYVQFLSDPERKRIEIEFPDA